MDLAEWLIIYVRHKDAHAKRLQDVKRDGDTVTFTFDDHILKGFCTADLVPPSGKEKTIVATLQTKANVQALIQQWKSFCTHPDLTIVFVNPRTNDRWLIKPRTHDAIAGGVTGIWSIADAVPYV